MAEEKTRIHTRISDKTKQKLETAMPKANCQSQNEFVENAICFYSDYIMTQEVTNLIRMSKAIFTKSRFQKY